MNSYAEIFPIEIEGWCYGIESFPGELSALTVKRVVLQLQPSFFKALREGIAIDIVSIARQFTIAARGVVSVREVAEWLVLAMPAPQYLDEDAMYLLANALSAADASNEGLIDLYNQFNSESQKRAA